MIDWKMSKEKFGTNQDFLHNKSKIWFKCDNCGKEYVLFYKTILERNRCNRNKCKFCVNKILTDELRIQRKSEYVRRSRDKIGRGILYQRWIEKLKNSFQLFIESKVYNSLFEDRRNNRIGNITKDFVLEMLQQQNYKCKLSGINLTHEKSLYDMSIDRIDNNYGHIKDNIQLICRGLNIAKNRHTNDDIIFFLDCLVGKKIFVPERFSRDYISSIRRNSEQRDRGRNFNNNLRTDDIVKMFESQNGLCTITGLPMACYQHSCFSCSIDRINNDLYHTIDNVHLVLKCINRAKSKFNIDQVQAWLNDIRNHYAEFN